MRHILFIPALCFTGVAAPADAHAFLVKSSPAAGSAATPNITELRLEFSEPVELVFSGVKLANASGAAVPLTGFGFEDAGHKILGAKLPMLMAGSYRVSWHVVSADTHRTEGSYTFTIRP